MHVARREHAPAPNCEALVLQWFALIFPWTRRASECERLERRSCGLRLVAAGALFVSSCTLTKGDFEPAEVVAQPTLAPQTLAPPTVAPISAAAADQVDASVPVSAGSESTCGDAEQERGVCELAPCVGLDCESATSPAPTSCDDGTQSGSESDVDCGGGCSEKCQIGQACATDFDCAATLLCSPETGVCSSATCEDGRLNHGEILVDCGGGDCPGCPVGTPCDAGSDCESNACGVDALCREATCDDGVVNSTEADVDCGGACPNRCDEGRPCNENADCMSGVCDGGGCGAGVVQCCQAPSCTDGVANGAEAGIDCGDVDGCPLCADGEPCTDPAECASGLCPLGTCQSVGACADGLQAATESDVDCGGPICPACVDGRRCFASADCRNLNCLNGVCISCGDSVINGSETDFDCGGSDPFCRRCADGRRCNQSSDCGNLNCLNGICISCGDSVINGSETDFDCGGSDPFCRRCADGRRCNQSSDCGNLNCLNGICISCGDGVTNGSETDIDCGGGDPFCQRCPAGRLCSVGTDCASGVCQGGRC